MCREMAAGASVVLASCWEFGVAGRGEKKRGSSLGLRRLPAGLKPQRCPPGLLPLEPVQAHSWTPG